MKFAIREGFLVPAPIMGTLRFLSQPRGTHLTDGTGANMLRRLFILAGAIALFGCATVGPNQQSIEFRSTPPGATISSGASVWGVAPIERVWTLNEGQKTSTSAPVTATWVSGASVTLTLKLEAGEEGVYTFMRPQGAPGLDADIQWAIHLENKDAAAAAAFSASMDKITAVRSKVKQNQLVRRG